MIDNYNTLKTKGFLHILLIDSKGNVKIDRKEDNIITTVGKGYIASRMVGSGTTILSHMAIGSGVTAESTSDTTLVAEEARVALASQSSTGNVCNFSATFPAGTGTGAIAEAGIFNAASAGSMLNRTKFNVINKEAGDTLTINWVVTLS